MQLVVNAEQLGPHDVPRSGVGISLTDDFKSHKNLTQNKATKAGALMAGEGGLPARNCVPHTEIQMPAA